MPACLAFLALQFPLGAKLGVGVSRLLGQHHHFPKPEGGSKTIELQSAEQPIGPWTTIEQTMVLSEKTQEFLRLTIKE